MLEPESPSIATEEEGLFFPSSKLPLLFAAVAGVLLASLVIVYLLGLVALNSLRSITMAEAAVDRLGATLSTIKDAETGQRGYLLLGDEKYLEPYHKAVSEIGEDLTVLTAMGAAGELPVEDVNDIKKLSDEKLTELELTIQQYKQGDAAAALSAVRSGAGRGLMDTLRQRVRRLTQAKQQEVNELRDEGNRATYIRTLSFLITGVANLALLRWSFGRIRREIQKRTDVAQRAARNRELMAVTLASIGDAVIVTDPKGRITFLNEMAIALTGWTLEDAKGLPCETVFNIINEETRRQVESPVTKVLRTGVVVGLANHTLLIRKDRVETPIDDSGAPIRGADGKVRGVVLVFRDFSEHKAAERQLQAAKEEAETANIAKDNFLATLSHELRTPLTPVLAILTSWEQRGNCPSEMVPDLQMLRRSVELESRLIDDLLDLTRIVKGKMRLNLEVADVHELITVVAEMYKSEILGKKIELTLQLDASQHHVTGDSGRMQQIFWNLLKNAAKFTPEGGKVDIQTTNEEGRVVVSVQDTGIGMSKETLGRLFQPFEQGSEEAVRRYGGLGLGLAISKALVEAQGGQIAASSEGAGRGAKFIVQFSAIHAPASDNTSMSAESPQERQHLQILLVEDHADTARVIGHLLRGMGHEVAVAHDVKGAVEQARARGFDLLLSDIGLPDGTGIDVLEQIKRIGCGGMVAIAMTGFGMEEDVARSLNAGFSEHLTKPINFQRLDGVIQRVAREKVKTSKAPL